MENIWSSNNIILKQTTAEDIDLFIDESGNYDTDLMKNYDYIDFPRSKQYLISSIEKSVSGQEDNFSFTIHNKSGEKVGYITVFDCDKKNGTFKYGIFIKESFKGRGYASESVKIVLNYYFNELRYNKVNVYIYDFNTPSIRFHEKSGFVFEGRLRQMSYSGGQYHDTLYYGMLKSEFNKSNF
ncbi:MAG: GNAT family N-acetyltransferase [Ruminococcaceae bacterium]|nr:GNAT family N-acetyltransferase [Oscillospiraceae bacterium]